MALFSAHEKQGMQTAEQSKSAPKKKPEEEQRERALQQNLSAITAQLALLEDRYGQVRNKVNFADHELVETKSRINKQIKVLDEELNDLNRTIQEIREKGEGLYDEVSRAARKEDVDVLEKYLDLWEPLQFVTRNELLKAVSELKQKK